ncbi:MAG: hypothetical protein U0939_23525 [Pirellulales bacterium]
MTGCSVPFQNLPPNDKGNPAAAKNRGFQNPPDPPHGLTALFADPLRFRDAEVAADLAGEKLIDFPVAWNGRLFSENMCPRVAST